MPPTKKFEDQSLLASPVTSPLNGRPRPPRLPKIFLVAILSAFACWSLSYSPILKSLRSADPDLGYNEEGDYEYLCPQAKALIPSKNRATWEDLVNGKLMTQDFKVKAIQWLSRAVQIKTESYDNMDPVGVDPRWDAFGPFHDYLLESFPLVHAKLALTKVNTWGLVYVWEGSNDSLRPILFAAHQDVVPVDPETVDQWEHPPYSGYFDGERIWGRGSTDDKSGLISVLASIETLIESGFKPTRKVVLAFGFDEEASGLQGAGSLAKYLISTFGENAFAFIVDEGGGFREEFGTIYASPAVVEKGYVDVRVEVASPGGHSSVPPPHTSIGMLAAMLVEYEANPYGVKLSRGTVTHDLVKCFAAHSPKMPSDLRKAIIESTYSDHALEEAANILFQNTMFKALVGNTQAIDLVGGGVKSNALPENAWAVVNHRVAIDSSVAEVVARDTSLLKPLAEKFNLSLTSFGNHITDPSLPSFGSLILSDAWGSGLEPSPITPYSSESPAYQILSGTIKSVYSTHRGLEGDDNVIVQPAYMTGNSDTCYYWKLTHNIFRYNHNNEAGPKALGNIHTVNESILTDGLFEMIQFFTTLILNADEASNL